MKNYDTLLEAVQGMQAKGYNANFSIVEGRLKANAQLLDLQPDEFMIDRFFRFEGDSDPGDETVLYAVSSEKFNIKGLLVSAYGAYDEGTSSQLAAKLDIRGREADLD